MTDFKHAGLWAMLRERIAKGVYDVDPLTYYEHQFLSVGHPTQPVKQVFLWRELQEGQKKRYYLIAEHVLNLLATISVFEAFAEVP